MIKGKDIRRVREKEGLSQARLANELNCHVNSVRNVEGMPDREVPEQFENWYKERMKK